MDKFFLKKLFENPIFLRVIAIIIVCLAILYLFYFFAISSANRQYAANYQKTIDIQAQLEAVINKQIMLKNETHNFSQFQNIFSQLQKKIVSYTNLPSLINELLKIGAENNLHFNSFLPSTEIKENSYIKVPVKIIAVGGYQQLANFLSQVANLPFIIFIDNFTISSEKGSDNKMSEGKLLTAEFNFEVYSFAGKK